MDSELPVFAHGVASGDPTPTQVILWTRITRPDDAGAEPAAVVEVFAADGETVLDLAAWPLGAPERVCTMFGRAPALGLAAARNPATSRPSRPTARCGFPR